MICYHGRISPNCCECDEERGKRPPVQLTPLEILRALWQGSVLRVWWSEWPEGSTRPTWTGCLRAPDASVRVLDCHASLAQLLEGDLIDRRKRLQKRDERREWRLSDRGLAQLGLPPKDVMRSVERREKVLSA